MVWRESMKSRRDGFNMQLDRRPAIIEHAPMALQPGPNCTLLEARILDRKLAGPLHRRRLFLLCLSDERYRRTKEGEKPEGAPHNNSR